MMPLDTVAHIQMYIDRHETVLGFKPTAVGISKKHWPNIMKEFESMRRYTEVDGTSTTAWYMGRVRLILNPLMEDLI